MMKKPVANRIELIGKYLLIGFLFIGSILDTISNSFSIFTFKSSLILTVLTILFWLTLEIIARKRGIKYKSQGTLLKIKKINFGIRLLFIAIIFVYWIPIIFSNPKPTIFDLAVNSLKEKESSFKVLVLPFNQMCKDTPTKDIGAEISERLNKIKEIHNIDLFSYYLDGYNSSVNFNTDSADSMINLTQVDLVIYGNYYDNQCLSDDSDEICYKWTMNEKNISSVFPRATNSSNSYNPISLEEIRSGKEQKETDYLIYWTAAYSSYNNGEFKKAIELCNHIYNTLAIESKDVAEILGFSYMTFRNLEKSTFYFKKALNTPPVILLKDAAYCSNIATYYMDSESENPQYSLGYEYSKKAVDILYQIGDQNEYNALLMGIAKYQLATAAHYLKEEKEAIDNYLDAERYLFNFKDSGTDRFLIDVYLKLYTYFHQKNDFRNGHEFCVKYFALAEKNYSIRSEDFQTAVLMMMECLLKVGDMESFCNLGIAISNDLKGICPNECQDFISLLGEGIKDCNN